MRKLLLILGLCFATNAIADQVHVKCWTGDKVIFNKQVEDVWLADNYIAAVGKINTSIISGDCVITFANLPKHFMV